MAAASPYRVAAETAAAPSRPPQNPFRPRLFRPTAHGLAILSSLLVHAVVLTASALSASGAPPPEETEAARFHSGAFLLHAEDFPVFCNWPPPSPLIGCFDRATLLQASYFAPAFGAYGTEATSPTTSTPIPYPFLNYDDPELAGYELEGSLNDCARTARLAGWKGEGRVFVRVTHRRGEGAIAQALPLDEASNHPGLLCCVRNSQLPLASTMKPGTTIKYTLSSPPEEGVTLTPPPF